MSFDRYHDEFREGLRLIREARWEEGRASFISFLSECGAEEEKRSFARYNLGIIESRRGCHREALAYFLGALERRDLLERHDIALICNERAFVYYRQNDLVKAFKSLDESRSCLDAERNGMAWAQYLHYHGLLSYRSHDRVTAMEMLNKAVSLYSESGYRAEEAQVLDTMGIIVSEMGDMEEALRCFQSSLSIKKESNDRYGMAITFGNLGRSSFQKLEYDRAIEYFTADLELCEEMSDIFGTMVMQNNLARVYTVKKEPSKAFELLKSSALSAAQAGNALWKAINLKDLAFNDLCRGELKRALAGVNSAASLFERLGMKSLLAESMRIKAMIMRAGGRLEESEELFYRSMKICEDLAIPFDMAEVLFQMGLLFRRKGDRQKALAYIAKAIEIGEKLKAPWLLSRFERFLAEVDEKEWLKLCLSRYVGSALSSSLLDVNRSVLHEGRKVRAHVLFAALHLSRDRLSGALPEEIVSLYNEYFGEFSDVILQEKGVVEGFIGDEMMAYFGVPEASGHDALAAVSSASTIMNRARDIAERREGRRLINCSVSCGINSGEVYAGNVGAYLRMQYKVTGSTVNLASRLLHKAEPWHIMMHGDTYREVEGKVSAGRMDPLRVKGLSAPQEVWDVEWSR
jgi:class 3 adenylate cyclase